MARRTTYSAWPGKRQRLHQRQSTASACPIWTKPVYGRLFPTCPFNQEEKHLAMTSILAQDCMSARRWSGCGRKISLSYSLNLHIKVAALLLPARAADVLLDAPSVAGAAAGAGDVLHDCRRSRRIRQFSAQASEPLPRSRRCGYSSCDGRGPSSKLAPSEMLTDRLPSSLKLKSSAPECEMLPPRPSLWLLELATAPLLPLYPLASVPASEPLLPCPSLWLLELATAPLPSP